VPLALRLSILGSSSCFEPPDRRRDVTPGSSGAESVHPVEALTNFMDTCGLKGGRSRLKRISHPALSEHEYDRVQAE